MKHRIYLNLFGLLTLFSANQALCAQFETKVGGKLMLDFDQFDDAFLESSTDEAPYNEFEVRRLRLSADVNYGKNWNGELSIDLGESGEIKDALIEYKGFDWANITIGRQRQPFGLERQTASKNLISIERTMTSSSLAPKRAIGVSTKGKIETINWNVGYFNDDSHDSISARVYARALKYNKHRIYLGASFNHGSLDGDEFRINESLEVNTADSLVEGDRIIADKQITLGAEALWQWRGWQAMSEWHSAAVDSISGDSYEYEGGYLQVSYLLSGKHRKFKNGALKSLKTSNDWELSARISQLELLNEGKRANTLNLGVSYIWNKDLKFMLNYIDAQYDENTQTNLGTSNIKTGTAWSFRTQYVF